MTFPRSPPNMQFVPRGVRNFGAGVTNLLWEGLYKEQNFRRCTHDSTVAIKA